MTHFQTTHDQEEDYIDEYGKTIQGDGGRDEEDNTGDGEPPTEE